MSTFDFTASSSWEVLGKMWQVTYGFLPSQEELMQFVMSGGIIASVAAAGIIPGQTGMGMEMGMEQGWTQSEQWAGPGGMGGYPNRGGGPAYGNGNGNGNTRNNQQQRGGYKYVGNQQNSDAIVLGEDISSESDAMQIESPQESPPPGEGGPGGQMQRVGDKWMFIRDAVTS
jgi:protein NRD1